MKTEIKSYLTVLIASAACAAQGVFGAPVPGIVADDYAVTSSGAGFVAMGDTSVTVSFDAQSKTVPPNPDAVPIQSLVAGVVANDGAFAGSYPAGGIEGVVFAVSNSIPASPMVTLVLKCTASDGYSRTWYLENLALGDETVAEKINNVAFHTAAGWVPNRRASSSFADDLTRVTSLGLIVQQASLPAQQATIRDMRLLLGNQVITPSALLRERVAAHFGLANGDELTDAQRAQDRDRDGISDYLELTETESDPDDANSSLLVKAERLRNGGLRLSWPAVVGRTYTVFRTETLLGDFEPVPSKINMYCDTTGEMDVTLANDRGKYFYSIQQVRQ